jgi:DNA-binding transcriptional regulator YhcF (GntR family)
MPLTPRQWLYASFVRNYFALHRRPPSVAEIASFYGVSPRTIDRALGVLTREGYIVREPGEPMALPSFAPDDEPPPTRPNDRIREPLDPEIAPLVEALREDRRVATMGSCCGHGRRHASVALGVRGFEGLDAFLRRINVVDRAVAPAAMLDVRVSWSELVLGSCNFEVFPDWIMLSLEIHGPGKNDAPSADLLARVAGLYRVIARGG